MYKKIVVPVDLAHTEALDKALATAADMAKHYAAQLTYLGVTTPQPTPLAHSPEEFEKKLSGFAAEDGAKRGVSPAAVSVSSHDPATDLDKDIVAKLAELRPGSPSAR